MSRSLVPLNLHSTLYRPWHMYLNTNEPYSRSLSNWRDYVCDFWLAKGYELDCGPNDEWSLPDNQLVFFLLTYGT